ncbi:MAG TPA: 4-hydroxy-tetrahydrodipicolinate synthase [Mesorhizobium sp.]|uniref:4-hydroxy-tetrahydrodipicolinate synthase n=1 Tax=Mesorhizobium sp. TaxID=1871066 RepID=UPI002DDD26D4|nr:4-hydroxy-tetrahydrodipicolinate synthase [Mesorhizobium sp.]HEV2504965.1 4-hydroxy-tetrahydrodipicolinate synthase [Mesorhizobium sp.]
MHIDRTRFKGAISALPTPFRKGAVDMAAFDFLIRWQLDQGIDGVVVCGTTGEAPTLTHDERLAVTRRCVETVAGQVPVIAGTGSNSTEETITATLAAAACGADAALVVTPYYNKPGQEGLYRHFAAIAQATTIPLILYNVPSRTGVDLLPDTVRRLAAFPAIIGIKDATGDLDRPERTAKLAGADFLQFSGHDATALAFNTICGAGTISVVANVAPGLCAEMHRACRNGDLLSARTIRHRLEPMVAALERETNPVPVKYALHRLLGLSPEVRLPLTPARQETEAAVEQAITALFPFDFDQPKRVAARR